MTRAGSTATVALWLAAFLTAGCPRDSLIDVTESQDTGAVAADGAAAVDATGRADAASTDVSPWDSATLPDVLGHLRNLHPTVMDDFAMNADGTLWPSIIVCVDGKQVDPSETKVLPDQATITLLSAISGG